VLDTYSAFLDNSLSPDLSLPSTLLFTISYSNSMSCSTALRNCRTLSLLSSTFLSRGYHVLRYNSRGVGSSTGWASFTGLKEAKDLEGVVKWGVEEVNKENGKEGVKEVVIAVSLAFLLYRCLMGRECQC
jgi:hypothetical protein